MKFSLGIWGANSYILPNVLSQGAAKKKKKKKINCPQFTRVLLQERM